MFISKMNRMFHKHGRIAFGLLTLVIIVPFVLYFSAGPSELLDMFDFSAKDSHVQMYGKTVSQEVLGNAVTGVLISLAAQGQNVDFASMRNEKQIIEQAADRIRLLKIVDERGLKTDDLSVVGYIRQLPMFQVKGDFNPSMYKIFVSYYLGRFGISEKQLEEVVQENILIDILKAQTVAGTIITENEVLQYYNDLNKTYEAQAIRFNSKDYEKDVKVSSDELQKYFEGNRKKYLIPAKYKIDVVRFNYIKYKKEAEKEVTDKDITAYYNTHKESFKEKNEKDARKEISEQLIQAKIESNAKNDAQKFAVSVYKKIETNDKKKPSQVFETAAEKMKFKVYSVNDWITSTTKVIPRLGKVPEIAGVLNSLYMDQPISNAIQGKNAFFVICLSDMITARQAKLEEVKDKVTAEYKAHEGKKLAENAAENTYKELDKSTSLDKSFTKMELKLEDIPDFSQKNYMPLVQVKDGVEMYQGISDTENGKVSVPIKVPEGAVLVYLKNIILPDAKSFSTEKKAVTEEYRKFKEWLLWFNYEEMLKAKSDTVIAEK